MPDTLNRRGRGGRKGSCQCRRSEILSVLHLECNPIQWNEAAFLNRSSEGEIRNENQSKHCAIDHNPNCGAFSSSPNRSTTTARAAQSQSGATAAAASDQPTNCWPAAASAAT